MGHYICPLHSVTAWHPFHMPQRNRATAKFCFQKKSAKANAGQPISRVLCDTCVSWPPFIWDDSRLSPQATNPGHEATAPHMHPLFGLAASGGYRATPVTRGAVRSYRTVSPLPVIPCGIHRRFVFCCPIRHALRRAQALPGAVLSCSPDFPHPLFSNKGRGGLADRHGSAMAEFCMQCK